MSGPGSHALPAALHGPGAGDPGPSRTTAPPAPSGAGGGGIHLFAWRVWPWLAWALPVLLVVRPFVLQAGGGWEALVILFVSPALIPAGGLLGMLPWFLLRRRGVRAAPRAVTWLLFVHWWSWLGLILALPGAGDSGRMPSALAALFGGALPTDGEYAIFLLASLSAIASWIAVLVVSLTSRRAASPRWTAAAWIALFACPALIVLGAVGSIYAASQERDAAGQTAREVAAEAIDVQAGRALERYTATQARLAEVREVISPVGEWEDWDIQRYGFDAFGSACDSSQDCYSFVASYDLEIPPSASLEGEVADFLEADGWLLDERDYGVSATDAEGYRIQVVTGPDGVTASIESPTWWGDGDELDDLIGDRDAQALPGRVFASDDWPPAP